MQYAHDFFQAPLVARFNFNEAVISEYTAILSL